MNLICGDDHNIYVVNIEDYLAGKGPPKLIHQFKDVHINKCMEIANYKQNDIVLTQKQGVLFYICLKKYKITRNVQKSE